LAAKGNAHPPGRPRSRLPFLVFRFLLLQLLFIDFVQVHLVALLDGRSRLRISGDMGGVGRVVVARYDPVKTDFDPVLLVAVFRGQFFLGPDRNSPARFWMENTARTVRADVMPSVEPFRSLFAFPGF
jgi:hypothetical protein